jgi:hypothetical protein
MSMHRHAMRALALASALAALAAPTTAAAAPADIHPQHVASKQAGQPTWPMNPQPLHDAESPAEDGGIGWSALAIGLGALGLTAGLAVVTPRARLRTRRRRTPA